MTYVQDIIDKATRSLQKVTDSPQREACLLLAHTLNETYEAIYFTKDRLISGNEEKAFIALLERRLNHEPLSKIREYREFWSLPFRVTADTLDPRPDSETLIEAVLGLYPDKTQALRILDLGTGTGCLLLSLLHEYPNAWGLGIDMSESACRIAQENAHNLKLSNRSAFMVGNWGQALGEPFDMIVSNPPYIGQHEPLPKEVEAYDPPLALFAGPDGLDCYRTLANQDPCLYKPDTMVFLELGAGQLAAITKIFCKWSLVKKVRDLQGHSRSAVFCMKSMPVE